jgi:hypothetical protein
MLGVLAAMTFAMLGATFHLVVGLGHVLAATAALRLLPLLLLLLMLGMRVGWRCTGSRRGHGKRRGDHDYHRESPEESNLKK